MSSICGNNIKISLFGESHGSYVGATLDGLGAGYEVDFNFINKELFKRKAKSNISTLRIEDDEVEFISGIYNGYTTGSPITVLIKNNNIKSEDYQKVKNIPRPSHADYVANIKYNGYNDFRGGGHFSGRLSAPLVALGALCRSILKTYNVEILAHIKSVGEQEAQDILDVVLTEGIIKDLDSDFPVLNQSDKARFKSVIIDARQNLDSVGGSVQVMIANLECGYGNPFFDSIESNISSHMFSIPGVKAIEFGKGIAISKSYGSICNDQYQLVDGKVRTSTNNNGGINGGISNGENIVFTTYFKPTPTIASKQKSVDLNAMETVEFSVDGRHDPCIVHRAIHVVANMCAFTILDIILSGKNK